MGIVVVTGSGGLIGAESCRHFAATHDTVVGIDNDMRSLFFGKAASSRWAFDELVNTLPNYIHHDIDIRDRELVDSLFSDLGSDLEAVIHTAAQPSHDWAARDPFTDFDINAQGTLNLLEATRRHAPSASFVFTSTNKVYGDLPNELPLLETESRWSLDPDHPWAENGIPESMSIDQSTHSLFGASKLAADILTQEYGKYFGMNTAVFRGGCLTGPGHSGAELHGFLAYLMMATTTGQPYTVFGYEAKQVRDNIHTHDFVRAIESVVHQPRPGVVYNMGGGVDQNVSMREAILLCEEIAGKKLSWQYSSDARRGDHKWYVSDLSRFRADHPEWRLTKGIRDTLVEIHDQGVRRWGQLPTK